MTNVIPLFSKQKPLVTFGDNTLAAELRSSPPESAASKTPDFESVMKKNKETAERLRKERNQANKNVLKSYRIK